MAGRGGHGEPLQEARTAPPLRPPPAPGPCLWPLGQLRSSRMGWDGTWEGRTEQAPWGPRGRDSGQALCSRGSAPRARPRAHSVRTAPPGGVPGPFPRAALRAGGPGCAVTANGKGGHARLPDGLTEQETRVTDRDRGLGASYKSGGMQSHPRIHRQKGGRVPGWAPWRWPAHT